MADDRVDPVDGGRPAAAGTHPPGRRRRPSGWLIVAVLFGAVFIAGIIINAVNEGRGAAPDFQSLLQRADAQPVVVCGILAGPLAAHGAGRVTLNGPRAARDPGDSTVLVVAPGQGPPSRIAAHTSVVVDATVRVRAGPGSSEVAELVDPTSIQVIGTCPSEIVPLSG